MKLKNTCEGSNTRLAYRGPVIVIVGPTGSGKTGVAIEIAKEIGGVLNSFNSNKGLEAGTDADFGNDEFLGEIISADSRAIYKGVDLGTAKPDMAERDGVVHFGFDLVEPGERFTVYDFQQYAEQKIKEIRARGHVPIIAGGTGLYVDALIYNYHFNDDVKNTYSDRQKMSKDFVVFGISWPAEELRERLRLRANKLFIQDLFDETRYLVERYGWGSQAMKSNIYQFAWKYMQGECSLQEAIALNVYDDWHLVKRQMTWFKRNPEIRWLPLDQIKSAVLNCVKESLQNLDDT